MTTRLIRPPQTSLNLPMKKTIFNENFPELSAKIIVKWQGGVAKGMFGKL